MTTAPLPYHPLGVPQLLYCGHGSAETGHSTATAVECVAHCCLSERIVLDAAYDMCPTLLVMSASYDCVC